MESGPIIRSLYSLRHLLPKNSLFRIYLLALARVFSNLLDVLGVAGIATLALAINGFVISKSKRSSFELPIFGQIVMSERMLVILAILTFGVFLLKSLISIILRLRTSIYVAKIESYLSTKLAIDFFARRFNSSREGTDSVSEFQNTAITSTEGISLFINSRISMIAETTLLFCIMGIFLLVNPIATIATTIFLFLVLGILRLIVRSKIRQKGMNKMKGSSLSLLYSRELFDVIREVRVSGTFDEWIEKFRESKKISATSNALISTLSSAPRYVIESALLFGILLFIGAIFVFSDIDSQALTLGVFMAGGLRLVALIVPLQISMNQMAEGAARGSSALCKLKEIQKPDNKVSHSSYVRSGSGPLALEFSRVCYGFGPKELFLKDISFTAKAGSKVAVVGPSGSGKSTLLEIASGFRVPLSGSAKLGQVEAANLLEKGSGEIGFVPQRTHLISGSLACNISLVSHKETDLNKVEQVLKMAGLSEFAGDKSLSWNIEPDSGSLSGGEIQRLGLARALYRNPRIIFLDEYTSSLDAKTEEAVNKALESLRGKVTSILVAHRLSSVKDSDLILYLDKGIIIATGTFFELMDKVKDFRTAVDLMGLD